LFGWLVSYENPDGRAIELREGKFFVTGNSIKATDLVIEDASISTPHALMSVSGEGGFKVQDLMSERGLFVRSREGGQYRREEGTVEIKHGDWLRFGDVEFLVTIVPTGSGR
jgi:pSer/pThr/pTyr-binding forkhead associated (FHA) protein